MQILTASTEIYCFSRHLVILQNTVHFYSGILASIFDMRN
jgi:hypothetical protein